MKTYVILCLSATLLALGGLMAINVLGEVAPATGYAIGDRATDFSLPGVDGKQVSLADFKDAKGFLVIFTCNDCPYAIAYQERIIALDNKYRPLGVPVIAIQPNSPQAKPGESLEKMRQRAEEMAYPFPYLLDEGQKIYPQYGATRTPHVFLLEKTGAGNIVRYIGAIDDNYRDPAQVEQRFVENAVDSLLAGGTIDPETTRAIGCSIK